MHYTLILMDIFRHYNKDALCYTKWDVVIMSDDGNSLYNAVRDNWPHRDKNDGMSDHNEYCCK